MTFKNFVSGLAATALAGLVALPNTASAEWKPAGPVTILIGFAAGGGTDTQARLIATEIEKRKALLEAPQEKGWWVKDEKKEQ